MSPRSGTGTTVLPPVVPVLLVGGETHPKPQLANKVWLAVVGNPLALTRRLVCLVSATTPKKMLVG
jgi:hypothetical protein